MISFRGSGGSGFVLTTSSEHIFEPAHNSSSNISETNGPALSKEVLNATKETEQQITTNLESIQQSELMGNFGLSDDGGMIFSTEDSF